MNECELVGDNQDINKSTEKLQICRFDLCEFTKRPFIMFCSSFATSLKAEALFFFIILSFTLKILLPY